MDALFESEFSLLTESGKPLSRCGICKRFMKYVKNPPPRLYCAECNVTYAFAFLFTQIRAAAQRNDQAVQGAEVSAGRLRPATVLAGQLGAVRRHDLPFLSFLLQQPAVRGNVSHGLQPVSPPDLPVRSSGQWRVSVRAESCFERSCPNDEEEEEDAGCDGMMVLDMESRPNWKLCCNKCNMIIRFTANIHDIHVMKKRCEECGSSLLKIQFNKNETPLKDGATEYSGCIMCDELLKGMLEIRSGRNKHVSLVRHRGRGRGRGRRGRGRGRGAGEKRSVFDYMFCVCVINHVGVNDTNHVGVDDTIHGRFD